MTACSGPRSLGKGGPRRRGHGQRPVSGRSWWPMDEAGEHGEVVLRMARRDCAPQDHLPGPRRRDVEPDALRTYRSQLPVAATQSAKVSLEFDRARSFWAVRYVGQWR